MNDQPTTEQSTPLTAEEEAEFRKEWDRWEEVDYFHEQEITYLMPRLFATIDRERERAGNFEFLHAELRSIYRSETRLLFDRAEKAEQERDEARQEVARLKSLLIECSEALHDDDPIACSCAKMDGFGNVAVPAYAGECLCCRLRTELTTRGELVNQASDVPVTGGDPRTPEWWDNFHKQ